MNVYMQVPGINGEVTAQGFQNWIQLESYGFDLDRQLNTRPGVITNREGTRPVVNEFSVTKYVDKSTPKLFSQATNGKAIPQATISVVTTGSNPQAYLTYTLSNVIVSHYKVSQDTLQQAAAQKSAETLPQKPLETLKLNFTKIEQKYVPMDKEHQAGSQEVASYDLETAEAG